MRPRVFAKKSFDRLYRYLWFDHRISARIACRKLESEVAEQNIWLLGIPRSMNLGDQAQVMCSERIFQEQFPGYKIHEYDSQELMKNGCMLLDCIASLVRERDLVFFQSGYNLTDMYPFQEEMHREVVRRIKDNRIVFLPQTISFQEPYSKNTFVAESLSLYQENGNVSLMCRDETSLDIARQALPGIRKRAFPDVVTSMVGRTDLGDSKREGVLLCVRHDEEGVLGESDMAKLRQSLENVSDVEQIDTTVDEPSQFFIRRDRKKYVFKMLDVFRSKRVVVTDRYHGLIFALVADTPAVLIRTIDHKLTGGVRWLPNEMLEHIKFATSIEEAADIAHRLAEHSQYQNTDFFYENYYRHLKSVVFDDGAWES